MAKKLLEDWPEYDFVAGLDEVGRGCGAGPVVTAAVIMPKGFKSPLIRDSKKLSEKQRNEAYELIMANAVAISCHAGSAIKINEVGINKATFNTMHKCIDDLSVKPEYLLVDGTVWEDYKGTNADNSKLTLVPKGDDTYTCIAAAAIVAKVRRDEYMAKLNEKFPKYNWAKNKGYLTPDHIQAIRDHGPNRYHRTLYIRNFVQQKLDL
jgi:ribonuclease HII